MIVFLVIIVFIVGIVILGTGFIYLRYFIPLRPKEDGFEYVYVNDDGTVRELYDHEIEYLKEEFHPTDGARPYIKSRYSSVAPDKRMSGFIQRNRIPKKVSIQNIDKQRSKMNYKEDETGASGIFSKSTNF